ncbi:MAG: hypothetical protein GY928_18665 [Colwellia sp.]|nr:hypothetical protein [Colwellia sp.]
MTKEELKKIDFTKKVKIRYKGDDYQVTGVNFGEMTIGFNYDWGSSDGQTYWARIENATLINYSEIDR